MRAPTDVIPFLAKGEAHWREGYSAHALAWSWWNATGLPLNVGRVLETHGDLKSAELVDAIFERQTDLQDGLRGPSQTDLLAVLGLPGELAIMGVEAKVEESFGPLIGDQSQLSPGQRQRLAGLAAMLNIDPRRLAPLRYQLFHRVAATILEAKRYRAAKAILLVQSFSERLTGFADFEAFLQTMGFPSEHRVGRVAGPIDVAGVAFYAAWLVDEAPRTIPSPPPLRPSARGDTCAPWRRRGPRGR